MSCTQFETLIALHVEGDLGERQAARVEKHLRECAGCRELASSLGESQAALKDLRSEPVDGSVLGPVRLRVLEQAEAARPSWIYAWRWKYAYALAGLVLVAGLALSLRRPLEQPPPRLIAPLLRAPAAPLVTAGRAPEPKTRQEPARVPARQVEERAPQEPLVVKLLTDDPDVVIYWVIDQAGG